jgi:hypothetical protein
MSEAGHPPGCGTAAAVDKLAGPPAPELRLPGLVESRRIAEQGLAIRRFGQNERLGDSTIRRFGYCGWSAQPALFAVWPAVPRNRKLCASTGPGYYYAPAVHNKAG